LGGKVEAIAQFTTPLSQSIRHCLYLRKIATTPANFPRAVGLPTQNPL
jgi:16S rRNA (guanine527-N7)-methyltransferase